ncbi:hypothetical protein AKJ09_00243 [Labilithrix luteola]|uniref:Fibronectin type-III domain-containing protein n=1 Tax=Labilithrix luteola TaxID=1391654 RepID=A0A0K1PKE5_9BACT|nr:hypothetical protein AKJ09_00243 [Labilithrix luteola]
MAACSSDSKPTDPIPASDAGNTEQTGNEADAGAEEDAESDAGKALAAPTITMVMKMAGGLHVTWTNNERDCDAIEGERKTKGTPGTDWAVVFTVPDGTVDNKHDAPLQAGTTYTYRLRCKKGADYSPYSNEMSGTP